MTANFPYLIHEGDGVIFVGGDTSKHDIYKLKLRAPSREAGHRAAPRGPARRTAARWRTRDDLLRGPQGRLLPRSEFIVAGAKIASATETYAKNRFGNNPVSAKLATDGDIQTGWSVAGRVGERHVAVFVLRSQSPAGQPDRSGDALRSALRQLARQVPRLRRGLERRRRRQRCVIRIDRLLAKPTAKLTEADELAQLKQAFLMQAPELAAHTKRIRELRKPARPGRSPW